jgi:hypothetical protein
MDFASKPEFVFGEWAGDYPENPEAAPLTPISSAPFYQRMP